MIVDPTFVAVTSSWGGGNGDPAVCAYGASCGGADQPVWLRDFPLVFGLVALAVLMLLLAAESVAAARVREGE